MMNGERASGPDADPAQEASIPWWVPKEQEGASGQELEVRSQKPEFNAEAQRGAE